jgi:hypothetical protein
MTDFIVPKKFPVSFIDEVCERAKVSVPNAWSILERERLDSESISKDDWAACIEEMQQFIRGLHFIETSAEVNIFLFNVRKRIRTRDLQADQAISPGEEYERDEPVVDT